MHEVDLSYMGLSSDDRPVADVAAWRLNERKRLIEERKCLSSVNRENLSRSIALNLDDVLGDVTRKVVSLYWPFLGEPDLRGWMSAAAMRGAIWSLPVVVGKGQPLVFRTWRFAEPLERGVWNIPVPSQGKEVRPDIVIAPVVGFDADGFRLGYGGGFFDRTLALLQPSPLVVGVGLNCKKIETIHPLHHDIPLDYIVTDVAVRRRRTQNRE